VSTRIVLGLPRSAASRSRTSTTWKALKPVLGTIASASRVWQSMTAKIRNGRPSNKASDTKSIAQQSFGPAASDRSER
jgi:hypothetical protein